MDAYLRILRPLLFRMDPERAHHLALWAVAAGLIRGKVLRDGRLNITAFGKQFPNPLGLAAGLDKDGVAARRWEQFGFGFAELGTLTAHPQPGNPKPRLFRFPDQKAIVNRMGFNNAGSEVAAKNLASTGWSIPIGMNIGKSKVTPLEDAVQDYATSYARLRPFADYVVVNVSSPNTVGLRSLQKVDFFEELLNSLHAMEGEHPPLLIKIAPDLLDEEIDEICRYVGGSEWAGIVATNTTLDKSAVPGAVGFEGGLSGAPLRIRSNAVLERVVGSLPESKTVIGVGGVFGGADVLEKLRIGAHLVQCYTGWVYGGPRMAYQTLTDLLALMEQRGFNSIADVRSS